VSTQLYSILDKLSSHSSTGLVPDWTDCNGNLGNSAVSTFCKDSGRDFWFDAVRTPWRMSLANAWSCDSKAAAQVTKMLNFFDSQGGASNVKTGYTVSGASLGGTDQGCFLAMASTLYVHSTDDAARAAYWQALTSSDPSDYFCDSLRLVAIAFTAGVMTPTFNPMPPPGPSPPPPPSSKYTCSAGQCIESAGGIYTNASTCHETCFARYSCDQSSQTCSVSSYGAYAGKDACLSVCRTSACSNRPYAQCGGTTWKGDTCCPNGYTCRGSGYYYQCQPSSSTMLAKGSAQNGFVPRSNETSSELHFAYHSARVLPRAVMRPGAPVEEA